MADEPQNENTNQDNPAPDAPEAPATDNPSEANAPAPVDETKNQDADKPRRGAKTATPPGGEVKANQGAKAHVLGEGEDADFDAVAHGKQTALENHVNDRPQV